MALWGRLDLLQRRTWLRVLATVLIVGASAGFFGSVVSIRHEWERASQAIGQSLAGDEAAVYGALLRENGSIVVEGEQYAGPVEVLRTLVDEDGTPKDVQRIVFVLLRDWIPDWAPRWLLLETSIAWALMFVCMVIGVAVIWSGLMVPVGTLLVVGGGLTGLFWLLAWDRWVGVPIAIAILLSTFLMSIRVLQMALAGRRGWMAVAHTLLQEVSRTRLAMGFVVALLVVLPLLLPPILQLPPPETAQEINPSV